MSDFLTQLYYTLTEDISPPVGDPKQERACQAYMEIEEQVKEKIGSDLLAQYQRAYYQAFCWEDTALFTCGLRFGARFILEVLGQS